MTIPLVNLDPTTENITDAGMQGPVTLNDGTQIWKLTHNGVDTHAVHVHLFNVQLINRVGWDGAVRPPDANELGWKETIRMNPLEDCIFALRAVAPSLPWKIGNSVRSPDVSQPTTFTFQSLNPITGQAYTVVNTPATYQWEYVWHCHLLGHEENDMMRPIAFQAAPNTPTSLRGSQTTTSPPTARLLWTNNATSKPFVGNWTLQRALDPDFAVSLSETTLTPAPASVDDTGLALGTYYYRIRSESAFAYSPWSNTATVVIASSLPTVPGAPTGLVGTPGRTTATSSWTAPVGSPPTGYFIERARTATGVWSQVGRVAGAVTSFTNNGLARRSDYYYRVRAYNALGNGPYSSVLLVTTL
jgi:hypothetical protein